MAAFIDALKALSGWNVPLVLLLAKATIILIAALGITLAMQRASATARHLVWLVALGTLLLMPALSTWGPLRVAVLPAAQAGMRQNQPIQSAPTVNPVPSPVPMVNDADNAAPEPTPQPIAIPGVFDRVFATMSSMSAVTLVLTIWAIVAVAILAVLGGAGLNVRRIVRRARRLESPDWETPLYEIADRLELEDAPGLLMSSDAKMPFACGMFKATIVLPAEAERWSLDRRRAVLLHELAHVKRHDLLGHTLGRLTCAVYWFHPLVWKAAKQLRSESERACDDLALACGTRATDYAEHLLDIVTSVRGDSTPLVALAMARRKEFEGRMLAILDPDLRHSTPTRRQSAALIGTLALIALTVGAVSPVARTAEAAPLTATGPQTTRATAPPDAPVEIAMIEKSYPGSSARGAGQVRIHQGDSTSTVLATAAAATAASAEAIARANGAISDEAIKRLEQSGMKFGMGVANMALEGLAAQFDKDTKGAKGSKGADDRPILLARVLRTDTSATLRRIAAWGLEDYSGSQVATDALAQALRNDTDAKVREMAAWALNSHNSSGVDALTAALKSDVNEKVRTIAAWALGNVGDRSAATALAAALSDASADVRIRAAWALGSVQPREAPRQLIAALSDKEPRMRKVVAWSLFTIADGDAAPALENALKSEVDKDVQIALIRALAATGEKSVGALSTLLQSSDPTVRQMAVRALAGGNASGPWPWPWPQPRPFP